MSMIFDSHAHYDSSKFKDDREAIIVSMPSRGVARIMNIASDIKSCTTSPALADKYDFIYATVGIHPHEASCYNNEVRDLIAGKAKNPKVMAIGEIGLDFFYDFSPRDVQEKVFVEQLQLAHELKMPVVIHSRDSHQLTLDIVKKYRPHGIVHCFSGSAELAEEFTSLGLYIGFTGVVTFNNAKKSLLAAKATPMDKLLIETDCPYMAPVPFRGSRCDSSMLFNVIETLAQIKGVSKDDMITTTWNNANRVYGIEA